MALQGEEIRRRLSEFAAVWGGYAGTEKAEAQTFLNGLLECYGTDRRAEGARFEERTADGFMDLFWPGVCIVEMKRPSEARKLPQHREQMLRYWQSSGTPAIPAPRYVVLCAFHRFEVWEPGALLDASQSGFVRRAEVGLEEGGSQHRESQPTLCHVGSSPTRLRGRLRRVRLGLSS